MRISSPLTRDTQQLLSDLLYVIEKVFPLPLRLQAQVPQTVATLSRLLTAERGARTVIYLNNRQHLSAYIRYFLPWNCYKLVKLLPNLSLDIADGDSITDLGSGPLTFALALWISRPDLRKRRIEIRCVDHAGAALEAGKKLFKVYTDSTWTVSGIHSSVHGPIFGNRARLVSAINLFNEQYEHIPHRADLLQTAYPLADLLSARTSDGILVVEPGIPQAGHFISSLRQALLEKRIMPHSPCCHRERCPLPFNSQKWCHFAFDTADAPVALQKLSQAAGIPKKRATLSFIYTRSKAPQTQHGGRVLSDMFPLSYSLCGRYACSACGLVLIGAQPSLMKQYDSGSCISFKKDPTRHDLKSGAWYSPFPEWS
ncbi:MAG: rRNA methyltransferase [Treponema sp.]|jgi:ribosomal protein RSM22 (predicted rRNA methylase)|nr:rRNA methyltransferase [Treponema sp.]